MPKLIVLVLTILPLGTTIANGTNIALNKANNDIHDEASLQNGAELFMNYCSGCHSIGYIRYGRLAKDLNIDIKLLKENLIFTGQRVGEKIISAMPTNDAADWFGVAPPDLSLTARSHGVDWIYSYLGAFYPDNARPFGVNNRVLHNVAMPDVLASRKATLGTEKFDNELRDITNFLDYVSEPIQLKRTSIGVNVLIFLVILLIFSYLLEKEYWQDVRYGNWRAKD